MKKRCRTKLVHEGQYVAEVDVELIEAADEWSPYISLEDAYKLDDVRVRYARGMSRQHLSMAKCIHLHR